MGFCYLSSSFFKNQNIKESIIKCGELSVKNIELSAPHPYQNLDEISSILKEFRQDGYKFILHNYFPPPKKSFVLNIASDDEEITKMCQSLVQNALKLSEEIDSPIYGIHAGYLSKAKETNNGMFEFSKDQVPYSKALDRSIEFINNIYSIFKKKKIQIVIENLFPSVSRNLSLNCDIDQIDDLMKNLPKEIGLLLDLGHMNISSRILQFDRDKFLNNYLTKYGDKLYEVHISENNGLKDEHRALESNSWQYLALKKISKVKIKNSFLNDRFYCLESRNATNEEIKINLDKINEIIN